MVTWKKAPECGDYKELLLFHPLGFISRLSAEWRAVSSKHKVLSALSCRYITSGALRARTLACTSHTPHDRFSALCDFHRRESRSTTRYVKVIYKYGIEDKWRPFGQPVFCNLRLGRNVFLNVLATRAPAHRVRNSQLDLALEQCHAKSELTDYWSVTTGDVEYRSIYYNLQEVNIWTCHNVIDLNYFSLALKLKMASSEFRLERSVELLPETKEIAEKELRETPERVREALERLRELLKENKDLYFADDDELLTIFLRPCKWYPESALALMRRVAEFKRENASLLDGLLPEHEKDAFLEHKVVNVMKGRDHKGRRVLIVNVGGTWDPKKVNADQLFRLFYLIHVAAMLEPESQVRGTVVVMDFHNMGWTQTMGLTPSFSKRLLTFIQDAMPLRLKEVHFVKQPMIFNVVWNMFKPFIREKLKTRIFFHGSKMSSLHKHMSPSHLPADYGGELPAIDYSGAEWYPVINDILPHVNNWNSYGFAKKT
ncbi:hypothetical protein O3G_MSEX006571 [Manduca sexta]|uniref:CRAL-TRIO domain-containing protein n=2 Tax=Manduca sexta TaxID=7130 RepID=A0A921Z3V7_MANSE|nr:hypothetical protein O3G_MSEX006571 [Manduca sexta]